MAECDLTFSTFSAGANSPTGVRKGWHAKVADQLISGKRFIGRTASAAATEPSLNTTRGHHSIIVDDCENNCKAYGSTYSRASDGKLKGHVTINEPIPTEECFPVQSPVGNLCNGCVWQYQRYFVTFEFLNLNPGCLPPTTPEIVPFVDGRTVVATLVDLGDQFPACPWRCFQNIPSTDPQLVAKWDMTRRPDNGLFQIILSWSPVGGGLNRLARFITNIDPGCTGIPEGVFFTDQVCADGNVYYSKITIEGSS